MSEGGWVTSTTKDGTENVREANAAKRLGRPLSKLETQLITDNLKNSTRPGYNKAQANVISSVAM